MAKLKEYNGRYCESEYEDAFISFTGSGRMEICFR